MQVLQRPEVKARLSAMGIEVVGSSPAELAATIKYEMARMDKVIKDASLRETG